MIRTLKTIIRGLGLSKEVCEVCGQKEYFVSKRTSDIGHGQKGTMTSKKEMCNRCWDILSKMI